MKPDFPKAGHRIAILVGEMGREGADRMEVLSALLFVAASGAHGNGFTEWSFGEAARSAFARYAELLAQGGVFFNHPAEKC